MTIMANGRDSDGFTPEMRPKFERALRLPLEPETGEVSAQRALSRPKWWDSPPWLDRVQLRNQRYQARQRARRAAVELSCPLPSWVTEEVRATPK